MHRNKKILIIIADITRAGGTERACINLANILRDNHKVSILSLGKNGMPFFELDKDVEVTFTNLNEIPKKLKDKFQWYGKTFKFLKHFINQSNYDVIIGEGHNISVFLPFLKNKGNTKIIASEHIDYNTIPSISKKMMLLAYSKLSSIVVLSKIAYEKIHKLNKNTFIIPNIIPFEMQQLSLLENKKIIMVGRLSKEKGYERLVPIAKKLLTDFPDWQINIYGNGDQVEEISNLYKKENLTNITINNPTPNIQEKYVDSPIFLITSYSEAMPMVIIEAQYCSLPVVGFRCEGTETLIKDGKTGFIVDTAEDFYDKLKLLILDKNKRREMGRCGLKDAEFYDKSNIKLLWEKVIQQ